MEYAGPLQPGRVIWILEQVCRALGEAHARGLIHRDIKPSNILLCERGLEGDVAKVVDFGLVKDLKGDVHLTRHEMLAGTPLYLAPESITEPESIDARCDLYSLGAVAHFLLTGKPVFSGATVIDICAKHLHAVPQAPSVLRSDVPPELDAIVLRCLAKAPGSRFDDATALRGALLACSGAKTWSALCAAEWWSAHGESFRAHSKERRRASSSAERHPASLRIDFETRGPL